MDLFNENERLGDKMRTIERITVDTINVLLKAHARASNLFDYIMFLILSHKKTYGPKAMPKPSDDATMHQR